MRDGGRSRNAWGFQARNKEARSPGVPHNCGAMRSSSLVVLLCLLAVLGCGRGDSGSRQLIQNKGSDTIVNVA